MRKIYFTLADPTHHEGEIIDIDGDRRGYIHVPENVYDQLCDFDWAEMDDGLVIRAYRCGCCGQLEFISLCEHLDSAAVCATN